jgi:hypothetical protein
MLGKPKSLKKKSWQLEQDEDDEERPAEVSSAFKQLQVNNPFAQATSFCSRRLVPRRSWLSKKLWPKIRRGWSA